MDDVSIHSLFRLPSYGFPSYVELLFQDEGIKVLDQIFHCLAYYIFQNCDKALKHLTTHSSTL